MNDMDLYCNDVDGSMAKRIEPILDDITENCRYVNNNQVQHWAIYRQVEMMDKHIETFDFVRKG